MKVALPLAFCTLPALAGCTTLQPAKLCTRVGAPVIQPRALDISFKRGSASQTITVHLAWSAPGAPFYTPYGPLQTVSINEGAAMAMIPTYRVSHIEDIWPTGITLRSARVGSYDLAIPYGIPAADIEIISIRASQFESTRLIRAIYPPAPNGS